MKPVTPDDLVALDDFTQSHPIKIDVVYAKPQHPDNMFKCGIYKNDARMWCHRIFAPIILRAAETCYREHKYIFELKDCLRPVEAQARMMETDIVRANSHWLEEPRLLSPPGKGGHPRGMAVDIILLTEAGEQIDMGTAFDYLSPDRNNNPAARNYRDFSEDILRHRQILEDAMVEAGKAEGHEVLPLPQEWWDFRFMPDHSNQYAPVSDRELPQDMQMMDH